MSDSVWPHRRRPTRLPVPGILQARTLEWVAISFSNAWKWKVKVNSLSRVRLLATPWTAAHQARLLVHGIFLARVLEWGVIAFSEPRHKWPQIHPPLADLTMWTHTAQRLIPQRTLLHSFPRSINAQEIVPHQWETAGPRLWLVGEKCAWKRFNSLFSFSTLFLCSLSWSNSASEFLKEKSLHYIEMTWSHVIN